jgi:hypothetical protein
MVERLSKWALKLELTNALQSGNAKQIALALRLMRMNKFPKSELKPILNDYLYDEVIDGIIKKY